MKVLLLVTLLVYDAMCQLPEKEGWTIAKGTYDIDWESTPFEVIPSASVRDESGKVIILQFYKASGASAGQFIIYFLASGPEYFISFCMRKKSFETSLPVIPEGGEMIWRFTKTKTSDSDIMLQFHCNDKEMLNVKLDEKTCDDRNYKNNEWKKYWGADVEKTMFAYNSNIDYFRAYKAPKTDGGYSDFSDWTKCSAECNGGKQSRTRTCTNPAPANGGADCVGDATETRDCNTGNCQVKDEDKEKFSFANSPKTSAVLLLFLTAFLVN